MTTDITLAQTIPADQIRNAGEPVFPELRKMVASNPRLLALVNAREAYGVAKYGQTLLTGDGRDTDIEVMNEALDLIVYLMKKFMQTGDWRWRMRVRDAIKLTTDILDTIDDVQRWPEAQP